MTPPSSASIFRKVATGVFALAVLTVAVALLTPASALPQTDIWDKLEHAGAFAGLAFLGFIAFPERTNVWRLVLALIAFGSVCELLQMFVPGRDSSLEDAIANALGVLLTSGLWWLGHLAIDWRSAEYKR